MDLTDKQWAVLENYLGMVHLACAQILLPAFMRCPLGLKQRAEYLGPVLFPEPAVPVDHPGPHVPGGAQQAVAAGAGPGWCAGRSWRYGGPSERNACSQG